MVIRYLSHWVRSFIFLIMDRLLRDNRGVMIMKDPSFLIRGVWIMETGHFSFHTSLLSRLYHLIIWHGGFNSESGPVYFGMDRISPWAELFLLGLSLKSLHKADVWAYCRPSILSLNTYIYPMGVTLPIVLI